MKKIQILIYVASAIFGSSLGWIIANQSYREYYKIPPDCILLVIDYYPSREIGGKNITELKFSCTHLITSANELVRSK